MATWNIGEGTTAGCYLIQSNAIFNWLDSVYFDVTTSECIVATNVVFKLEKKVDDKWEDQNSDISYSDKGCYYKFCGEWLFLYPGSYRVRAVCTECDFDDEYIRFEYIVGGYGLYVVDTSGNLLSGVRVTCENYDDCTKVEEHTTDSNGRVLFTKLTEGNDYRFVFYKLGYDSIEYNKPSIKNETYDGIEITQSTKRGSINVITNLSSAFFTVYGMPYIYRGCGKTWSRPEAPAGSYTIEYEDVEGYYTPPSEKKTLSSGGTITFKGKYIEIEYGYLKVSEENGVSSKLYELVDDTEEYICDLTCTTKLEEGVDYKFRVKPTNTAKYANVDFSKNIENADACPKTVPCTYEVTLPTRPPKPSSLTIKDITYKDATADWIKPDTVDKYRVEVYEGASRIWDEETTSTSYDILGLKPLTTYSVSVSSIKDEVSSLPAETTFITDDLPPLPSPDYGYLYVTSIPSGANVYVDKTSIGTTPIDGYEIEEGVYDIKLTLTDYNDFIIDDVEIVKNKNKIINECLTPLTFKLDLKKVTATTITVIWDSLCNVSYFLVYKDSSSLRVGGGSSQKYFGSLDEVTEYVFLVEAYDVLGNLLAKSNKLCVKTGVGKCPGRISLSSTPSDAEVFIDGVDTGKTTPIEFSFCGRCTYNEGFHSFKLVKKGYESYSFDEEIYAGDIYEKDITLTEISKGTIYVETNLSSGSWTIGGKNTGDTYTGSGKTWNTQAYPDDYQITYNAVVGYKTPSSDTDTLKEGGSITFKGTYVKVQKKVGYLSLDTDPSDAMVFLDNKYLDNTPIVKADVDVDTYTMDIFKFGYAIITKQITITSGQVNDLGTISMVSVEMKKIGSIEIIGGVYDICSYCEEIYEQLGGFIYEHIPPIEFTYLGYPSLASTAYDNIPSESKPSDYPKSVVLNDIEGIIYYYLGYTNIGNSKTGCNL